MLFLLFIPLLLSGCGALTQAPQTFWKPPTLVPSPSASPVPTSTATQSPSATPTSSPTPTETATPLPSETPTLTPTPTWEPAGPGEVTAPILLYHHIGENAANNRYYISPQVFEKQMQELKNWGYQTITAAYLAEVILQGGSLPGRPVVITFDDGDLDVFENAFPILDELGFVATMYVVSNYMDQPNYISTEQLQQLAQAGWEIGSHSSNHYDLTLNYGLLYQELYQSRQDIETRVGVQVSTFAYPFGKVDPNVFAKTRDYGYAAGMGLGTSVEHSLYTVYYLSRQEVQSAYDLDAFSTLLPWKPQPNEP